MHSALKNSLTWFTVCALVVTAGSILTGCVAKGTGAGEFGIGYSSTSRVFIYQNADGDKNDSAFNSELQVQALEDWLASKKVTPNENGND